MKLVSMDRCSRSGKVLTRSTISSVMNTNTTISPPSRVRVSTCLCVRVYDSWCPVSKALCQDAGIDPPSTTQAIRALGHHPGSISFGGKAHCVQCSHNAMLQGFLVGDLRIATCFSSRSPGGEVCDSKGSCCCANFVCSSLGLVCCVFPC